MAEHYLALPFLPGCLPGGNRPLIFFLIFRSRAITPGILHHRHRFGRRLVILPFPVELLQRLFGICLAVEGLSFQLTPF
jgi:hypothetical protein